MDATKFSMKLYSYILIMSEEHDIMDTIPHVVVWLQADAWDSCETKQGLRNILGILFRKKSIIPKELFPFPIELTLITKFCGITKPNA